MRRGRGRLEDDEVSRRRDAEHPLAERAFEALLAAGLQLAVGRRRLRAGHDVAGRRLREAEVLEVPRQRGLRHVDPAALKAVLQLFLRVHGAVADDLQDLVASPQRGRMTIHVYEYSFIIAARQAFSFVTEATRSTAFGG